jgi:conjugative transposon TraN protein
MKRAIAIIMMLASLVAVYGVPRSVHPIKLDVSDVKYLHLKFPSEIKYADFGDGDVTGEKTSAGSILKIKSEIPYFDPTNVTVVTTDGKFYSFQVVYNANPRYLAVNMKNVKDSISEADEIPYQKIEVSDAKTSHLIFGQKVSDIDLGCDSLIAEGADKDIDNIVKIKCISSDMPQTSITVTTVKGEVFPFLVDYAANPSVLSLNMGDSTSNAFFQGVAVNEDEMKKMAENVVSDGMKINNIGTQSGSMSFALYSIYTDQDVIMFYMHTDNQSHIDYSLDFVKSYIRDKKETKQTAIQEDEIVPLYTYYSDPTQVVHGHGGLDIVFFFKRFTVPNGRLLYFEMFEANGGRHVKFSMPNKMIIKNSELYSHKGGK